jgi:hypothetical protein
MTDDWRGRIEKSRLKEMNYNYALYLDVHLNSNNSGLTIVYVLGCKSAQSN